jgi:hypothetical protein
MQLQLPSTMRLRGIALAALSTLVVALFCAGAARAETTGFTTGDTTTCDGCLVYVNQGADYGQSFTATSDGDLTKVTTHLSRLVYNDSGGDTADYPWQPVTVEVHPYSGGQVGAAVLASTTIAPDAVYLPAVNGPYDTSKTADAVFSNPAHLTNGQHYALVFSTQTPDYQQSTGASGYYVLAYYPSAYSGYCSLGYTQYCGGQIYAGGDMLHIDADGSTYTYTDFGGSDLLLTGFYGADVTAPAITANSPQDGATYGRGDQVAASYSCADEQGGSGLATCAGNVASGQNVDTSTLGQHTFTVQAADNAGNTSSKQVSYTVVDRTPPQVTLNTPADGAAFKLNQSVLADFGCTDQQGGSGLASCLGTAASGSRIDTGTVGSKTFTVNAADNAGNKTSKTNGYSVIYDWTGFFSPINNPTVVNTLKAGQAVPVKFTLAGNKGLGVLADGYPKSQAITCATNPATDAVEETLTSSQSGLSYDAAAGQYIYVWKTSSTWTGCRQLVVKLADGTVHRANFQMK